MDTVSVDDLFAVIGKLYVETLVLKKQAGDLSKAAYDLQAGGFFDADRDRAPRRDARPDDPDVPPLRREVPPA